MRFMPYRRDVPSGVWAVEEYDKLPDFDLETPYQPPSVFLCHQQDGRICAGWAGCHDMSESLGLRIVGTTQMTEEDLEATLDYECPIPLWESGAAAAAHGKAQVEHPSEEAVRTVVNLRRKTRRSTPTPKKGGSSGK